MTNKPFKLVAVALANKMARRKMSSADTLSGISPSAAPSGNPESVQSREKQPCMPDILLAREIAVLLQPVLEDALGHLMRFAFGEGAPTGPQACPSTFDIGKGLDDSALGLGGVLGLQAAMDFLAADKRITVEPLYSHRALLSSGLRSA